MTRKLEKQSVQLVLELELPLELVHSIHCSCTYQDQLIRHFVIAFSCHQKIKEGSVTVIVVAILSLTIISSLLKFIVPT